MKHAALLIAIIPGLLLAGLILSRLLSRLILTGLLAGLRWIAGPATGRLGLGLPGGAWASVKGRAQIEALVRQCQAQEGVRGEAIAREFERYLTRRGSED